MEDLKKKSGLDVNDKEIVFPNPSKQVSASIIWMLRKTERMKCFLPLPKARK